ncbi:hypothetical protein MGL_0956 [Malassezia globosa CBS 7966]|uniref:Phosphatidyl-N-methylethanolamine N-methyltransferase n=1 Tax=Malassezia globosa (strain ATCC MYA-4612 / CBS 7966) TaxID=425265 RepID=A8PVU2_MALGO|nr:uncharacterized protein MGL_0956 [Malassezia globosa CBS 7966]EDP44474.1 hypothetical protein MGL_0956 [Malassezia globosa CBS 7966]
MSEFVSTWFTPPVGVQKGWVDFSKSSFWIAVVSILFNPTFWNIVAQNEYRNKSITRLLGGRRYLGCYLLAFTIFTLGILRDHLYQRALEEQPVHTMLMHPAVRVLAVVLIASGTVFVLSSMWMLGITGTYLGDYFGILMDHMVTGFPFSVLNDPMYVGSTLNFVGVALWYARPSGLLLSVLVWVTYRVALCFESPFTANIYREAAEKRKEKPVQEARRAPSAAAPAISSHEDGPSSSHAPYAARYQTRQRAL